MTPKPRFAQLTIDLHVATVVGVGLLPLAPGTWASLAVMIIAWIVGSSIYTMIGFGLLAILSAIAGFVSIRRVQDEWGVDPGFVVIDEVCGMAVVFCTPLATSSIAWIIASFLLFRMYDIAKPWPIGLVNARTDAFSVVFDDVLAALFTIISIYAFQFVVNLGILTLLVR